MPCTVSQADRPRTARIRAMRIMGNLFDSMVTGLAYIEFSRVWPAAVMSRPAPWIVSQADRPNTARTKAIRIMANLMRVIDTRKLAS